MKWLLVLAIVATLVIVTVSLAATKHASNPAPPPGIAPENWHPISDDLGIILIQQNEANALGTLMARIDSKWVRVSFSPPVQQGPMPAR